MAHILGIILDVDGTLVDSNGLHARAWADALQEHGLAVDEQRIRQLIGMGGDNLLPQVANVDKDSQLGSRISTRRSEIFKARYLAQVRPLPGARELVERMRNDRLKLIVASSAQKDELEQLLRIAGVGELLPERISAEDAAHSKPDPDVVQLALDKLGLPADQALMLGDTPYDLQAARKAGVNTIGLRSGGWSDAEMAGSVGIYDNPADLLAHYDTSPIVRGAELHRSF